MWMTEGLDEGPVFLSRATPIEGEENAGALGARLTEMGADLLVESLAALEAGRVERHEQDASRATYAPKIRSGDGRLSFEEPAVALERRVRAYTPAPGAWVDLESGRLGVLAARAEGGAGADGGGPGSGAAPRGLDPLPIPPGTVTAIDRDRGMAVACAEGTLWIARVRPAGRKEMAASDFANGARFRAGSRLALAPSAS
jgi:methionyl-tRNA formyltransferase